MIDLKFLFSALRLVQGIINRYIIIFLLQNIIEIEKIENVSLSYVELLVKLTQIINLFYYPQFILKCRHDLKRTKISGDKKFKQMININYLHRK